ncbi:MAG: BREX-4 system phosphatase PglZ [Mangrovibacterium sp.]
MTAAEKIKIFNSIDDIISEIENDRQSTSILSRRYAVRFIMLDNFDIYREFVTQLTAIGIKSFDIENLLTTEKDRWITQDELKNEIRNITKSSIVSPFSEVARFYDDVKFKMFFNEISLLENSHDNLVRRIYIPLIGLRNRFENFLNSFARIAESAPVWSIRSNAPQKVNLFLVKNNIFPENNQGLKTLYDWLRFWKTQAPVEKIVCSSLSVTVNAKNSQPDNIFTPTQIDSAHDFIEKFYNLSLNIPYLETEETYWLQLLSYIADKSFSFNQFIKKYFNVHELLIKDIINKWTAESSKEFDRWLLKHYYLSLIAGNEYLNEILKDCVDYSSLRLIREIALSIFVDTNAKKLIVDRNNLLNLFDEQYKLPDSDLSEMKEQILNIAQSDIEKAISLCSGRFDFEKEMFIGWYKVGKLPLSELQNLFPSFSAYLEDIKYDNWVNSYIQAYKQAKIEDKYTNQIKNFITKKNANEEAFYQWYHSFELSKELLAKEKPDKVYWIDGLGIEYLSLIQEIINNSSFKIQKLQIAKTGIPSSTEHNKFENVEKIDDLDNFSHNNLYQYPQTICKEIDIVKDIFEKILNQPTETTLVIVSDHGLTALSRLVDSKKYMAKASHEGRYIKLDSTDCLEDSDYIRYKNGEDNFKVALTHASLNTKPVREVHGGCTPEEILVPFILLSNKKESSGGTPKHIVEQTNSKAITPKQTTGFEEEELF